MQFADGCCAHTQSNLCAFWNRVFTAPVWRPSSAFGLVEQIREFGTRTLESSRIDVGNIIGDDLEIELLGRHARRGNCERPHADPPP